MPFYASSLTIAAQFVSVVIAASVVVMQRRSLSLAFAELCDFQPLMSFLPVGAVYCLSDMLQTLACNAASAPVIMVVSQTKLVLTAILSKVFLDSRKPTNWLRIIIISCAAIAGTDVGAGYQEVLLRRSELAGACVALLKAGFSAAGAVVSEKFYKRAENAGFWVVSFRVQLMMLVTSLAILPWTAPEIWQTSFQEFFFGGPLPLCSPLQVGTSCNCVDRRGWNSATVLAVLAFVVNGMTTGLMLQNLSAVSKAVCNALSAGLFYTSYVFMGFRPFNVAQACIYAIIAISCYEYAIEKVAASSLPLALGRV